MKNDRFSQRKALPDRYFTMKEVSAIMQADEAQIKSWIKPTVCILFTSITNLESAKPS
jgi:hypothetical protein